MKVPYPKKNTIRFSLENKLEISITQIFSGGVLTPSASTV